jgi:glycosyltransferase involved in cell wall biosynthesis
MITTDTKFLSFCIPTYGQSQQVRKTLESLIGQELEGVEIVIRDDNQDSETEKVVSEYKSRLPIRYFHMEKEGVDRAFLFLSKEAVGKFVWWFGDDILEPGSMERVKGFLKTNPSIDFMYVNSTDLSGEHYSIKLGGSRYFVDRNEVVSKLKDQLGFCSAMLFKRETLILGLNKAESCVGTFWVTFFLVLHTLASGKSFYFFEGRNFRSEPKPVGESRWYDSFLIHGINFAIVANLFKDSFNPEALQKMLNDKFSRSWRAVVIERALGFKTGFAAANLNFTILFRLYGSNPEFYVAVPLMVIPNKILIRLYGLYKKIGLLRN